MMDDLPKSVGDYFTGKNAGDFDTAVSGFSEAATVKDEHKDHQGRAEIRRWMEKTFAAYNDRADLLSAVPRGEGVDVATRVSGTFPGSPVVLTFRFTLDGGAISRLEVGQ